MASSTPNEPARAANADQPDLPDNTQKNPDDWVSGDDRMTGAQSSYLKTLSDQAQEPDQFDEGLTKAEASKRIDALKTKIAE